MLLHSEVAEGFPKKSCTIICLSNTTQLRTLFVNSRFLCEDLINISTKTLKEHLKVTRNKPDTDFELKILFFSAVIDKDWQSVLK